MFFFKGEMIEYYHANVGKTEFFSRKAYTYTMHAHLHLKSQVFDQGNLESHVLNTFEVINYL